MAKKRTDGDGSIYQRHTKACDRPTNAKGVTTCKCPWQGVWVATWKIDPETGKRTAVRRKVTGKSRPDAALLLRELQERERAGELPASGVTVGQWMHYWYTRVAPRRCKPHTIAGYRAKVDYITALLGDHPLERLTPEHIEDAWDYLLDNGHPIASKAKNRNENGVPTPTPLALNTVHQTHRILCRALKVAVQRKKLKANPAGSDSMDAPPIVKGDIKPMTEAEVDAVLDACRGTWNSARWSVALALGLRQGEALGLRWEDVDLDAGNLFVRQTLMRVTGKGLVFGTPKSDTSNRGVGIPPSLVAALRSHKATQSARRLEVGDQWVDSGLVFTMDNGAPIDPGVDYRRWRRLLADAGVRHYRLHDARHSAGTMMLAQGIDVRVVMATLGHSSLAITMRYQHTVDEMKKAAAAAMDGDSRWA